MRKASLGIALALSLAPGLALAGWGAIAYNYATGANSESHGYGTYEAAVNAALWACGGGCSIMNWEHDQCNAFATGPGKWGESHGYSDANSAVNAAVDACGYGCTWREWTCN
jgi:hypothetical protein